MNLHPNLSVRPIHDNILVCAPSVPAEEKIGALFMPQSAIEAPRESVVIATGPGKRNKKGNIVPLDVQVGDKVIYPRYAGSDVACDGVTYILMAEDEILGVLEQV